MDERYGQRDVCESAISNDENGCRHLCLFIRIFINFFQLSNHFLLYTPIDLRFQLYQQSNQTLHSDQPKNLSNRF